MQTKGIRLWSKNHTLVSAPSVGHFFFTNHDELFPFLLFRQLCLYISDSLHLFTLFLTDSLEKCQTKSFENEYSTFFNFQIRYHQSTLQIFQKSKCFSQRMHNHQTKLLPTLIDKNMMEMYCLYC